MGSLSDFGVGAGTTVLTAAALTGIPTAALRAGDFAYVSQTGQWWAFDPASVLATGANTVYADVALNNVANAGRWRKTDLAFV